MAGKVRTWVWVVVGIAIVGILGLVAMAGVGLYVFTRHVNTKSASPAVAARDFDAVKQQFEGQKPLIELDDAGEFLRANTDREAPVNAASPEALHVLAFDPSEARVVKVSIPFWLLRLQSRGTTIDFNGRRMNLEDLKLTVEDLERYGPTLIVDHKGGSGQRVLVWSQ